MMDRWLLTVVVFSAQLLVVVGVATIAESLSRVTDPRLRLRFWHGVALACLALPLLGAVAPDAVQGGGTLFGATAVASTFEPGLPLVQVAGSAAWWLLCAGALARLGWLGAGAVRLRQLRERSRPAIVAADIEALRSGLAPHAEFRICRDVAQPAVFGLRRPVVLLPDAFFALEPEAQRAVACHELLHVVRRDWPWIVVEEVARALFWFHPAIWWLVERIQESREQLVDRLVIARVPSKRAYMEALLAFAAGHRLPAPAMAFLRTRHLRSRLRAIGKESVMSRTRSICTAAVLVSVMGAAVGATAIAVPLGSPPGDVAAGAQDVVDGKEAGVRLPTVRSSVKPQYTPEAKEAKIQGTVLMTAVVRTDGTPGEITVTKSLDAEHGLDRQAVVALEQWRFEPGQKDGKRVAVRVTVEMTFTLK
jgi:TonB family protein